MESRPSWLLSQEPPRKRLLRESTLAAMPWDSELILGLIYWPNKSIAYIVVLVLVEAGVSLTTYNLGSFRSNYVVNVD